MPRTWLSSPKLRDTYSRTESGQTLRAGREVWEGGEVVCEGSDGLTKEGPPKARRFEERVVKAGAVTFSQSFPKFQIISEHSPDIFARERES